MADQWDGDTNMRRTSRDVADELRSQIELGKYEIGDKLPTYRDLAPEFGVSVNTAMKAVSILTAEGLVDHRPNGASLVADPRQHLDPAVEIRALHAELSDLRAQVQEAGDNLSVINRRLSQVVARLGAIGG